MADEKVYPEGNQRIDWYPLNGFANPNKPTKAELNSGVNLTPAVAWDGSTVDVSESTDVDDGSWADTGNAQSAGSDQYSITLTKFYPRVMTNPSDAYVAAYQAFKSDRTAGYLVHRVGFGTSAEAYDDGQFASIYRVISDFNAHDTEGDDSVKFITEFLPQGYMQQNFVVTDGTVDPAISPATLTLDIGDKALVTTTLAGAKVTQGSEFVSSAPAVATVSANGVVTAISAGTANITATHPQGDGASTACVVTVS